MRDYRVLDRKKSESDKHDSPIVCNGNSRQGASPLNDALFLHFKKWNPEILEEHNKLRDYNFKELIECLSS